MLNNTLNFILCLVDLGILKFQKDQGLNCNFKNQKPNRHKVQNSQIKFINLNYKFSSYNLEKVRI